MALPKSRINLKYKDIDGGRKSIYLDYYKGGKRVRESLRLYLLPETDRKAIAGNKTVMRQAREILRIRLEELAASDNGLEIEATVPDIPLANIIKDYHSVVLGRGDKSTASNIMGMYRAVKAYRGEDVMLSAVDVEYCDGLVDFLRDEYHSVHGKLKMTTARAYIYLFSAALNLAVENGLIRRNPLFFVKIHDRITRERPKKLHLSVDEIKLLMDTQCPVISRPQVKQAYMLSVFTGLTAPDVAGLRWTDIKTPPDGKRSVWCASRKIFVPLSSNAVRWLPETSNRRGLVFKGLPKDTETNNILKLWQKKSGIEKRLNFTLARNTFAYLILSAGADVATFCSLMGIASKNAKGYLAMIDRKPAPMEEKLKVLQLD
ncbi:site-specific integrase [Muribaculum intestinale]|uniref:site-specific integrase n=1 Tax=Muribaculum intestinale TaxID=1796646 RepID=UPI0025A95677|nr:site-specific integrase [Muribaculum intestinale]